MQREHPNKHFMNFSINPFLAGRHVQTACPKFNNTFQKSKKLLNSVTISGISVRNAVKQVQTCLVFGPVFHETNSYE